MFLLLSAPSAAQEARPSEEIPIEFCDKLPVVVARTEGRPLRLLLDTAATTILNLKSFSQGASKSIEISSWSGTAATSAREVRLPDLTLGGMRIEKLKLPAVDLSAIGKACGGRIDGILGVDLLDALRAKIDLERRVAMLSHARAAQGVPQKKNAAEPEISEFEARCIEAFNRADAAALEQCFDAETVLYAPEGDFRGPRQVMEHIARRYFQGSSPAKFEIKLSDTHRMGDVHWHGFAFEITRGEERIRGRGTSVCRLREGKWRLLTMHGALAPPGAAAPAPR
jgi:ketosteroid isomerase-like protein